MAAPLGVYFFALLSALVVTGSNSLGAHELIAMGSFAGLSIILMRSLRMLSESAMDGSADEADKSVQRYRPFVRVPAAVRDYLQSNRIAFVPRLHRRAVGAQQLAQMIHKSGHRIAKPVLVNADGAVWMVVVPASERVDLYAVGHALHAREVELVPESELPELFPDCEVGAEPPLGRLYHVPTLVESDLAHEGSIAFHGGSHDESIELEFTDYARLERPLVAHVATAA